MLNSKDNVVVADEGVIFAALKIMNIQLIINKTAVLKEVAQSSEYTGSKMGDDDKKAYERIRIVDADKTELDRFWNESRAEVAQSFIRLFVSDNTEDTNNGTMYNLNLKVSDSFDSALIPSMTLGLYSFFVLNIIGKWYVYSNKGEAGQYADKSAVLLEEVKEKAYYKKTPTRPVFN